LEGAGYREMRSGQHQCNVPLCPARLHCEGSLRVPASNGKEVGGDMASRVTRCATWAKAGKSTEIMMLYWERKDPDGPIPTAGFLLQPRYAFRFVALHPGPDVLPVVVADNRFCGRRNLEKLGFWTARLGHPLADQDLGFPCRLRFLLVRYGKEGQVCRPAHICLAGHLDSLGANAFERRRAKQGKHTPACLRPLRLPFDPFNHPLPALPLHQTDA
jgi:hypothetical protein